MNFHLSIIQLGVNSEKIQSTQRQGVTVKLPCQREDHNQILEIKQVEQVTKQIYHHNDI